MIIPANRSEEVKAAILERLKEQDRANIQREAIQEAKKRRDDLRRQVLAKSTIDPTALPPSFRAWSIRSAEYWGREAA
jgi:hypothetical protein